MSPCNIPDLAHLLPGPLLGLQPAELCWEAGWGEVWEHPTMTSKSVSGIFRGQQGSWVTPKWNMGYLLVTHGVRGVLSPLGWVRSLSLWAARRSGRWKRPRVRPLSSLSEDGIDRLLSSSKDRSLSESESAPGVGKVRRNIRQWPGEVRNVGVLREALAM